MDKFSELLSLARRRDSHALEELFRYTSSILCNRMHVPLPVVRRRVSSSDVVQDALLLALKSIDRFQGTTEPEYRAWVLKIARGVSADVVRTHLYAAKRSCKTEEEVVNDFSPQCGTSPSQRVVRDEMIANLQKIIDRLPEAQRVAFRYKYFDCLTLSSIAEKMNRSEVAVAGLLKRGLAFLRSESKE